MRPDTQFTGFQHVWRTQNNGGSAGVPRSELPVPRADVEPGSCGDWVPLGVAYPFAAGSTPDSASRKPGDLTSDFYGTDRTGGLDRRRRAHAGRHRHALGRDELRPAVRREERRRRRPPSVEFVRIDTPVTPDRFVTRIVVDPHDPNVAFVSYSGFNALTPATPGHVFRAVYDPAHATRDVHVDGLRSRRHADQHDRVRRRRAAICMRRRTSARWCSRRARRSWQIAGVGFPEALMVDLEIVPEQRLLVAATHGLGIFYLTLK